MKTADLIPHVRGLLAERATADQSDADLLDAFAARRDEAAFTALVRRHGPLVLATARRALGGNADADDVFQATFLVLARNASSIRNRQALAGWLHGVASRMARTARRAAARRRTHEARATRPEAPSTLVDLSWVEVQALFETQLALLPDRFRVPFVLCALEGEPRAEVARQLGIKEGTISSRLAEAKRRLQAGLSSRGVSLSAVVGTLSLGSLAVPSALVAAAVRTATAPGTATAAVLTLIRGGIMTAPKLILAAALVALSAGVALTGPGGSPEAPRDTPRAAHQKDSPPNPAPVKDDAKAAGFRGRLLDEAGKPLADVPVRVWSFRVGDGELKPVATTDADGRFRLVPTPDQITDDARVVLVPPGRPAVWASVSRFGKDELTLSVPADDVPFTGRIVSLENQPLKNVTVEIVRVGVPANGDLTAWLNKNVSLRKDQIWLNDDGLSTLPGRHVLPTVKASTAADGTFRFTGLGRDRVVAVRVTGPQVETKFFWAVTRTGGPAGGYITLENFNHGVYGPEVKVMLAPSRPLVGTVRDRKTGKPVAGLKVTAVHSYIAKAITDENGQYRIEGDPKRPRYGIGVAGQKGVPYFDVAVLDIADTAGLDPLTTDILVDRGVEVSGRVVDKATGKPAAAEVMYFPLKSNPNAFERAALITTSDGWRTKPDGSFFITVWPGQGVLTVHATADSRYPVVDLVAQFNKLDIPSRPVAPTHRIVELNASDDPKSAQITVELVSGGTRTGTVVGPDGKPLNGVRAAGVLVGNRPEPLTSAEFQMIGLTPKRERLLLFIHDEK